MSNISIFPRTQPELCPNCKTPLEETSHGWVRSYWPDLAEEFGVPAHTIHTEKCTKRPGYCITPCPMCSGGVEAKRQAQLINDLFSESNIPHYARDWTFASFPEDADHNALMAVRLRIGDWLEQKPTRGGLYLVGENARCKTSLAISALHAWLHKGHDGVFILMADLFDKLKESIAASKRNADYQDRYEAGQGAKLIRLVKSVELLILDDLGVECGSPYEIKELYLILEARRSRGLFTIFTSNCDAQALAGHWRSEKYGVFDDSKRIISRLGEYCFVVPLAGRNQRQKPGEGKRGN